MLLNVTPNMVITISNVYYMLVKFLKNKILDDTLQSEVMKQIRRKK